MEFDKILDSFSRTTDEIFSLEELRELLESGRQLRIKYGVDVTAPFLHIGHGVNLWMMRQLQDMGHKVIFLIGDFTTRIGDPTGKNKTRPVIPEEEIQKNMEAFIEQARMVLRFDDPELIEIRRNSEWLDPLPTGSFLKLLSMVTHARLVSRDMFQKRMEANDDIYMHELIYPVLQAYDSVMIDSDLTIIGSDQLFNEMLGRFFQEKHGKKPQVIITTKITPGIDGKAKQSKSLDNYIGLGHSPRDKFGRVMRIPDELIVQYFEVYTDVAGAVLEDIRRRVQTDPMACKKMLAAEIVKRYHGTETAEAELRYFSDTFSRRIVPEDIPVLELETREISALELLRAFFGSSKSTSELKRLISQGGVSVNDSRIDSGDVLIAIEGDIIVKAGKRTWFRVTEKNRAQ